MTRDGIDEDREAQEIIDRLSARYPDQPEANVVEAVNEARSRFETAKVRDFVPVLVEREAKARLEHPI